MINFENYTVKDLNTHSKSVVDLQWNNEGNYLGTVSHDKTVKIGQLDTSGSTKTIHAIPHNHTDISLIGWNPNDSSKFALAGEDKSIELWDVRGEYCCNFSTY
jgi:WD40 repeat protein